MTQTWKPVYEFSGVASPPLLCGPWGLNSGCQASALTPLPTHAAAPFPPLEFLWGVSSP